MTYDYVIVGAGSAGCVLANRLSADPAISVLLIEAGPPDGGLLMAMPRAVGLINVEGGKSTFWYEASRGGNRGTEPWAKGRTIGGSSSTNGMVYIRGMPADYDAWAEDGCAGWGWDAIGPCFVELEDHALGAAPYRGVGGPLHITFDRPGSPLVDALTAAASEQGVPVVDDINDVTTEKSGSFGLQPQTIYRGRRFSAASAFLHPVRHRKNLTILSNAQAQRILFEGDRAVGLEFKDATGFRTVKGREIILSAGAIESPKLLQLSGIGPAEVLRAAGVEVRADRQAVGGNLLEHRYFSMQFKVNRGSSNAALRGLGLLPSALAFFLARKGPLTRTMFDLGGFVKTRLGLDRPDAQLGIGLFTLTLKNGRVATPPWHGMTIGGYHTRPTSQGRTDIVSADPNVMPRIDANYFAVAEDREASVALVRWMRRFMASPAMAPFAPEEFTIGASIQADDDILEALIQRGSSGKHVLGTCRMGVDDAAVVDTSLRVKGFKGLRVCDTSVMPKIVSGNTNGPAMAVALHAAKIFLAERAR